MIFREPTFDQLKKKDQFANSYIKLVFLDTKETKNLDFNQQQMVGKIRAVHNVVREQKGLTIQSLATPIPESESNSGSFYFSGYSTDSPTNDIVVWKCNLFDDGIDDTSRRTQLAGIKNVAQTIQIRRITPFILKQNVNTGWAQIIPFIKAQGLNFVHTHVVAFKDIEKSIVGICEADLQGNIGVTSICKSFSLPAKTNALSCEGCEIPQKGCYFSLSNLEPPTANKITSFMYFSNSQSVQIPYISPVTSKELSLSVMMNIISMDEKNWVKTYGFEKVTSFVVDLSKIPSANTILQITRQEVIAGLRIQETKYEISVSTIPNLFANYKYPTALAKKNWYVDEYFQVDLDPLKFSGNGIEFEVNSKASQIPIEQITIGDNPTNIFLDRLDILPQVILPKNTRILLYDDVAMSYYPDGNLTFSLCGVRDSNLIAIHCIPEYVIALDKSEKISYFDTFLNKLGILLTDSQAKFETRMVLQLIGIDENNQIVNQITAQMQDEKRTEYNSQDISFARKEAPGIRIKLQGQINPPKPARILQDGSKLVKDQVMNLGNSPYFSSVVFGFVVKDWDYYWGIDTSMASLGQKARFHAFMIIDKKDQISSKIITYLAKYEFNIQLSLDAKKIESLKFESMWNISASTGVSTKENYNSGLKFKCGKIKRSGSV